MRIDLHNHVMPTSALRLLTSVTKYGVTIEAGQWEGGHHVPFHVTDSFFDPQARLDELDRAGLDGAVISPAPPLFYYDLDTEASADLCQATNEGLAEFCRFSPSRLRWMAHLPMQSPPRAVEMLRTAVDMGAVGVAVATSIAGRRLDESDYGEFWAAAASHGLPVLIHPAFNTEHAALAPWYLQNVCGNPLETTLTVERLICAGVLASNPSLKVILMHGGGFFPYQAGRLRHARNVRPELQATPEDTLGGLRQLFFDIIVHDREALRFLITRVGPANVVIGTDMPFDMGAYRPMDELQAVADDATVRQIAEENPAALYGWPTTAAENVPDTGAASKL